MELLVAVSLAMFVAGLVAVPLVVANLPSDYFTRSPRRSRHPVIAAARNLVGALLVLFGIILSLPLIPGQGILTILLGLSFMDFPRKRELLLWLVHRDAVRKAVAWIRERAGKPPLEIPES